jgi:hypothetical protein
MSSTSQPLWVLFNDRREDHRPPVGAASAWAGIGAEQNSAAQVGRHVLGVQEAAQASAAISGVLNVSGMPSAQPVPVPRYARPLAACGGTHCTGACHGSCACLRGHVERGLRLHGHDAVEQVGAPGHRARTGMVVDGALAIGQPGGARIDNQGHGKHRAMTRVHGPFNREIRNAIDGQRDPRLP